MRLCDVIMAVNNETIEGPENLKDEQDREKYNSLLTNISSSLETEKVAKYNYRTIMTSGCKKKKRY